MTPDELIAVLERAAQLGIDPVRMLLALGFQPASPLAVSAGRVSAS
jgi:hypothetical protein